MQTRAITIGDEYPHPPLTPSIPKQLFLVTEYQPGPSSWHTRVSTIVSGVSPDRVEFPLEWRNLTFWARLLSTLLQPRVSRVPKWRKARCNEATENVFHHFICLLGCTFVKCMIKLQEIKWTSKIYLSRHLPIWFYAFSSELSMKRSNKLKTTGYNTVSHLCFFAILKKEQKISYLQLGRRLNGKMLVLGFLYSKSTPIVQQKQKCNMSNDCVFH